MAILKLAKLWDMPETHTKAVAGLDEEMQRRTPGEKIALAKRYDVERWFQEGFKALVKDYTTAMSTQERDLIGWETYARVLEAKQKAWKQCFANHYERRSNYGFAACPNTRWPNKCQPCSDCLQFLCPTGITSVLGELAIADCEQLAKEAFGSP